MPSERTWSEQSFSNQADCRWQPAGETPHKTNSNTGPSLDRKQNQLKKRITNFILSTVQIFLPLMLDNHCNQHCSMFPMFTKTIVLAEVFKTVCAEKYPIFNSGGNCCTLVAKRGCSVRVNYLFCYWMLQLLRNKTAKLHFHKTRSGLLRVGWSSVRNNPQLSPRSWSSASLWEFLMSKYRGGSARCQNQLIKCFPPLVVK